MLFGEIADIINSMKTLIEIANLTKKRIDSGFVKKIVEDFKEEMKNTTGDLGKIKEEELAKAGVEV